LAGISSFSFRMARKVRPWRGVGIRYQPQASGASEGGRPIDGHYCRRSV